jgi:hypothetical protein
MFYPTIHWDSSVGAMTWARGWTTSDSRFLEDSREYSLLEKLIEVADSAEVRL